MNPLIISLITVAGALRQRTAVRVRDARAGNADWGMSTLEVAIIALGLMLVAGILVGAITAAVRSRVSQLG